MEKWDLSGSSWSTLLLIYSYKAVLFCRYPHTCILFFFSVSVLPTSSMKSLCLNARKLYISLIFVPQLQESSICRNKYTNWRKGCSNDMHLYELFIMKCTEVLYSPSPLNPTLQSLRNTPTFNLFYEATNKKQSSLPLTLLYNNPLSLQPNENQDLPNDYWPRLTCPRKGETLSS